MLFYSKFLSKTDLKSISFCLVLNNLILIVQTPSKQDIRSGKIFLNLVSIDAVYLLFLLQFHEVLLKIKISYLGFSQLTTELRKLCYRQISNRLKLKVNLLHHICQRLVIRWMSHLHQ